MASKKLRSSQGTIKKKLTKTSEFNKMKFFNAQNSNTADFQRRFSKQTLDNVSKLSDPTAIFTAKSLLPYDATSKKAHASVNMASINSNVNKQLNRSSPKMDTTFLRRPEIPMVLKKSHVTFSEYCNLMAKSYHSSDSEYFGGNDTNSSLSLGQPIYEIIPRTEELGKYNQDNSRQCNLSVEANQRREAILSQNWPPPGVYLYDQDKTNVSKEEPLYDEVLEMYSKQTDTNKEVVSIDHRVGKDPVGNNECELNESLILQKEPVTTNVLSMDRTDAERGSYLEYEDSCQPFTPQYSDQGQIVVHRPYPGVVEECERSAYVPRAYLPPVRETVCELPYDDSVFPTKHRLGTSEDMRAAMAQARKQTYYNRENYAGREVGAEDSFALIKSLRPSYSRFTHTTRSDLHLKYRQVMAEVHRRSFNDWKSEISVTAGQVQEPNEETKNVTNAFLEQFGYLDCPRCHQRVTGLYGKPCSCRKITHYIDSNRCYINSQKHTGIWNSRSEIPRSNLAVNRNLMGCELVPSPLLTSAEGDQSPHSNCTGENETERNNVNTGLLGDTGTAALSPYEGTKCNNTVNVTPTTRASGEPETSVGQADEDWRSASTTDTRKSTPSHKKSMTLLEAFEALNPRESKSRPLRDWEINTLEFTLKKCLSEKGGILRSPELSL